MAVFYVWPNSVARWLREGHIMTNKIVSLSSMNAELVLLHTSTQPYSAKITLPSSKQPPILVPYKYSHLFLNVSWLTKMNTMLYLGTLVWQPHLLFWSHFDSHSWRISHPSAFVKNLSLIVCSQSDRMQIGAELCKNLSHIVKRIQIRKVYDLAN